jgi:1,4-alpha-glucan branching enzyme
VVKQAPVKGRKAVKVNFVLPTDAVAGKVSVVGDFNGWDPLAHPLRPRRNGTRSAVVTLPPGHRFAFRYLARAAAGTTTTPPRPSSPTVSAATTPSSTPSGTATTRAVAGLGCGHGPQG